MQTEKELRAAGFEMKMGFAFGANVDTWVKFETAGDVTFILRDTTTGATSEPFTAVAARRGTV